jgi:hypothetical protein
MAAIAAPALLHHIQHVITETENALRNSPDDRDILEHFEQRLDFLVDILVQLIQQDPLTPSLQVILHQLRISRRLVLNALEIVDNIGIVHPTISIEVATGQGRPKILVDASIITFLRELGFTWVKIAMIAGIHPRTLYRRRQELGIEDSHAEMSEISDEDLDNIIKAIKTIQPYTGETLLQGFLRSQGYQIPRARVRASLRRIDPLATSVRWIFTRETRRLVTVHQQLGKEE